MSLSSLALTEAASSRASPMADWVPAEDDTVKACTPNLQALTGWKKPCVVGVLLINTVGFLQL